MIKDVQEKTRMKRSFKTSLLEEGILFLLTMIFQMIPSVQRVPGCFSIEDQQPQHFHRIFKEVVIFESKNQQFIGKFVVLVWINLIYVSLN